MAIRIKFSYSSKEECKKEMEKMHNALVGTPAYIENDIALCEDGENEFYLVVGADNGKDIDLSIMSYKNNDESYIETEQSIDNHISDFLEQISSLIRGSIDEFTHKGLVRCTKMYNPVTNSMSPVYQVDSSIMAQVIRNCGRTSQTKFLRELADRNILVRFTDGKRLRLSVQKIINNERHKIYAIRIARLPLPPKE